MTTITLRQYRPSEPLELGSDVLRSLVSNFGNRVDIRPTGDGRVTLTGTKYVGLVRTEDLELVIQPKVPTLSVFWMLGFADRFVRLRFDESPFDVESGLLDVLARLFAKQTELVIRRGLYREYVERTDNLRFVRGRIEVLGDLRTNRGLRHQVVCRYADLTADVPHNRILRAVTDQLLRFQFRLPGITEQLGWNAAHLGEVERVPISERDFASLRYDRLNSHYQTVHALARLIVRNFTFRFDLGTHGAPSFLVNMDRVFEEFLRRLIEERAQPQGLRLRPPGGLFLDADRRVKIAPDILLADGQGIRAAIDAKYKVTDPEADIYQALAYAKGLGLDRVALVYPADGEVAPIDHRIRHDDVQVLVRTVPVGHGVAGFVDLERRAEASMSALIRELVPGLSDTIAA